ncbi:extracellular solute-binding protein [Haloarcula marina]|uniref:extracellular solute-binding protein n=1 Tax=Haloarcula marina TaxID=2961574 RepID=UPI0020B8E34A|nr:extracellular solute-binding protein [Halomicroarcula marina]
MSSDNYSRRKYIGLAASMAAGGLAGCGGGSDGGSGGSDGSDGGSTTSGDGGGGGGSSASLTLWTDAIDSQAANTQQLVRDNIDTDISFVDMRYDSIKQQYLTGASTGTPDLVEATPNHRGDYVSADLIEPLTDRVEELDYSDGYIGLDMMTYKEDVWALPHIGNGRGFVYREDIFEKYGFDVPDNWSDFVTIGAEISANEDGMHGFTLTSQKGNTRGLQEFLSFLFQRVDSVFNPTEDGFELNATAEDFGIVFKEYFHDPFFATETPATNPDARGIDSLAHDIAYMNGNYAAISTGPWLPGLAEGSDDTNEQATSNYENSVATHNPRVEGGEKGTYAEVKPLFMNSNSENKDAAWDAMSTISSPEGIGTFLSEVPGNLPAHEDVEWNVPEDTNNPGWSGFQDVFATGKSYGFWSVSKVSSTWFDLSQQVMYDQIDPMEAGQQLYDAWSSAASDI